MIVRIYSIEGATSNEFIINVTMNGNATNALLVKWRMLSLNFVEVNPFGVGLVVGLGSWSVLL